MNDTPTPEQQEVDIVADLLGRYASFTPTADMVDDEIHDLHQLGFRVVPVPDEDTQPTPSHSATLRELEQVRAERDAAVARAEAAEKWQTMWADKWSEAERVKAHLYGKVAENIARADAAEAEAQRLHEGIARHRHDHTDVDGEPVWPRCEDDTDLWSLLAEQPEGSE